MPPSLFNNVSSKLSSLFKGEISQSSLSEGNMITHTRFVHLPVGTFFIREAQTSFSEPSFIHQKCKIMGCLLLDQF